MNYRENEQVSVSQTDVLLNAQKGDVPTKGLNPQVSTFRPYTTSQDTCKKADTNVALNLEGTK
jgi:hypothetical protein